MSNNGHMPKAEWIEGVMARYEGPLIRYAAQMVGDMDRARDVVQDTFLKLCEHEPAALEEYLASWLFTVCRNRALDVQRREGRLKTVDDAELDRCSSPDLPPDKIIELRESSSDLLKMIETLPWRQQELVRLKFQNGLSYAEISRITHLSVSNVGFILHRAMQTLRRQVKASSELCSSRPSVTSYEN
jgi:RNA polymerase sigma-70 factor (ECF subfamily)